MALGLVAGAGGVAFLLLAAQAGLGPGSAFPLLVLWLVAVTLVARGARRLAARMRKAS